MVILNSQLSQEASEPLSILRLVSKWRLVKNWREKERSTQFLLRTMIPGYTKCPRRTWVTSLNGTTIQRMDAEENFAMMLLLMHMLQLRRQVIIRSTISIIRRTSLREEWMSKSTDSPLLFFHL